MNVFGGTGFVKFLLMYWVLVMVCALGVLNLKMNRGQHYSILASSFLSGSVELGKNVDSLIDVVEYEGKNYWHLGLFPAFLMVPLVWLRSGVIQGYVQLVVIGAVMFLMYALSRRWGLLSKYNSVLLSISTCLGTVFLQETLTSSSWHFAQVVAVTMIFLYLIELLILKNELRAGLWMALAFLTRPVSIVGGIVALLLILFKKVSLVEKINKLMLFGFPVAVGMLVMFGYNWIRFGSIFETGNLYSMRNSPYITHVVYEDIKKNGMFQLRFMPGNFYDYFFRLPDLVLSGDGKLSFPFITVNNPGCVSFLITSPIFGYLLFADLKNSLNRIMLFTSGVLLVLILMFVGNGGNQIGPRYMNDILPYGFVVLISVFKKRGFGKIAMASSIFASILILYLYLFKGGI